MDWHRNETSFEEAVRTAVGTGAIAGAVGAVTTPRETTIEVAHGWRDHDRSAAMGLDTVFALASMTKTVTAVAAMQLVEQGRIGLDEPLGGLLRHFARPMVLEGFDENGEPKLRPARHPVTLRRLLSHASGLGHDIWSDDLLRYKAFTGLPPLSSQTNASLDIPLLSDPGTRWEYSIGLEWTGKVIEALTGDTIGAYLAEHVTGPLGMVDTVFGVDPRHDGRLAGVFERQAGGLLQPTDFAILPGEYQAGGGGLYGTARDFLIFLRMVLNQGRHGEHRILKPETVRAMAAEQIGDLAVSRMVTVMPHLSHDVDPFFGLDAGWNLGGMLMREAGPNGRPAGSWGWGGLANCYFWVDPINEVAGLILSQVLPFGDPTVLELFGLLENETYRRLEQQASR